MVPGLVPGAYGRAISGEIKFIQQSIGPVKLFIGLKNCNTRFFPKKYDEFF